MYNIDRVLRHKKNKRIGASGIPKDISLCRIIVTGWHGNAWGLAQASDCPDKTHDPTDWVRQKSEPPQVRAAGAAPEAADSG
jgi:hypothetical protein